jgi:hypothetical protein
MPAAWKLVQIKGAGGGCEAIRKPKPPARYALRVARTQSRRLT